MDINEFDKKLEKTMTYTNYKKAILFLNACCGEGLGIDKVDAGDLLYFDILANLDNNNEDFWFILDKETDKFINKES